MRVFRTLKATYATIKAFDVTPALRKGRTGVCFQSHPDICHRGWSVERAFGIGAGALAEAVRLIVKRMKRDAA